MKFNTVQQVVNHEGSKSFIQSPEMELYSLVCTSLVEDKFYEKKEDQLTRLKGLCNKVNSKFLKNLALYAREVMHLRSISHVLIVELARRTSKNPRMKNVVERICQRPDDMTEILSYYIKQYGKPVTNQLKKGLALAFAKFDEYQLQKYTKQSTKKEVSIIDVVRLCHPKRTELTEKVVMNTLSTAYTWETEVSANGNNAEVWSKLITSNKIGHMALIRNLRNILNVVESKDILKEVVNRIEDEKEVKSSKQFPFRYFSAYQEIKDNKNKYTKYVLSALEKACEYSASNIELSGSSLIAADVSGSMQKEISKNSKVQNIHIGLVMMGIAKKISNLSLTGIFGNTFAIKNYSGGVLAPALTYKEGEVGYSTNGYLAMEYLNKNKTFVDNILIFTDCEMYGKSDINSEFNKYKKVNPNAKLFLFNLGGYNTVQFPEKNVYTISGWSESVFKYINMLSYKQAALSEINNYN